MKYKNKPLVTNMPLLMQWTAKLLFNLRFIYVCLSYLLRLNLNLIYTTSTDDNKILWWQQADLMTETVGGQAGRVWTHFYQLAVISTNFMKYFLIIY